MMTMSRVRGGSRLLRSAAIVGVASIAIGGVIVSASTGAVASRSLMVGPLGVSGASIVDEGSSGVPVTLQGVNMYALTSEADAAGFVDANAIDTLQSWGANFVRLDISSDEYLQQCGGESYDTGYRAQLAQTVQQLTSRGTFVLLDLYSTNPSCLWSSSELSGVVPLPGFDVSQVLGDLVSEFGGNGLVGYEPFNEPEACALSATGTGASEYVPDDSEPGGVCPTEVQSKLAWNDPGTVVVGGTRFMGMIVGGRRYQAPGMAQLYETIMAHVPSGASAPLVFTDPNGWAADPSTFDSMSPVLAGATNIVEVFHPYDCQDTSSYPQGFQSARCMEPSPESCSTTTTNVDKFLVDPGTGEGWSRPVVFDEFNFPGGEARYYSQPSQGLLSAQVPILMYQHGYWVNNTIAAIQHSAADGWAIYYFQNADVSDMQSPYAMVPAGISASTPAPWAPNVNDAPAVSAMQGATLACEAPPPGFG